MKANYEQTESGTLYYRYKTLSGLERRGVLPLTKWRHFLNRLASQNYQNLTFQVRYPDGGFNAWEGTQKKEAVKTLKAFIDG